MVKDESHILYERLIPTLSMCVGDSMVGGGGVCRQVLWCSWGS